MQGGFELVQNIIREIKIEDVEEVTSFVRRCIKEVNSKVYPAEVINYIHNYYSPEFLKSIINKKHIIVYEENSKVFGTASINLEERYISSVFVDPDHHHKGIGTQLMNAIEDYAKDKRLKKVYLNASLNAENFYKDRGYKKIKKMKNPNFGLTIKMRKKL